MAKFKQGDRVRAAASLGMQGRPWVGIATGTIVAQGEPHPMIGAVWLVQWDPHVSAWRGIGQEPECCLELLEPDDGEWAAEKVRSVLKVYREPIAPISVHSQNSQTEKP